MPEGRQSPPPERQTGAQQQAPPADGQGTDDATNKQQTLKDQLQVRLFLKTLLTTPLDPRVTKGNSL